MAMGAPPFVLRAASALSALFVGLAACAAPPASDVDAPRTAMLELGSGEDVFTPIVPGQTLDIARGCQGSQHVWIALRATGIVARGPTVRVELLDPATERPVSLELYVRLSFEELGDGRSELRALTLQIPTPEDALGRDLTLRAEVVDREGVTVSAEASVRVAWGTEVCGA